MCTSNEAHTTAKSCSLDASGQLTYRNNSAFNCYQQYQNAIRNQPLIRFLSTEKFYSARMIRHRCRSMTSALLISLRWTIRLSLIVIHKVFYLSTQEAFCIDSSKLYRQLNDSIPWWLKIHLVKVNVSVIFITFFTCNTHILSIQKPDGTRYFICALHVQ